MSDISDDRYAYQLVEGLSLTQNYGSGSLSPITRSDVGLRRPSSLSPGNLHNSAPRKKKQKLNFPVVVQGNDGDGSIFDDDDFGGKGKDKILPLDQLPCEAISTDLQCDANSSIFDIDDLVLFSRNFSDFNFDSAPTALAVSPEVNLQSFINQSPEASLAVLQNSSDLSEEISEATVTFESSSHLVPLLHAPLEEKRYEGHPICGSVAASDYNQQEPTVTCSTDSNDFVLYNISETESMHVPRKLTEYQDEPERESKQKQLIAFCTLTVMEKNIKAILEKMANGSIKGEDLCELTQSEMDKWRNLEKYIQAEGKVVDKSPQLQAPVTISTVPDAEDSPMEIEGYKISLSTYAAAYSHIDIKNSAVDIFEELFTEEEKRTVTLSGRVCIKGDGTKGKTPRLDPKRLNVINHAIASMMKKKGTYHYSVNDFKDLKKTDFKAIKEGLSQRVNQIKQAQKKAGQIHS